ncbi:hypothetical protein Pfo_018716 [Paulownia fortunei]|nr:hypothetical protein Pfo_018716 [Paulownia fortunei]
MAERNTSVGFSKSRSVLGDLTNRLGKRGLSEREKSGVKSFNFNDKDIGKRLRVSPRPCTEINSLKGNVVSSISNITNENRDANVLQFGCSAVSKSSIDAEADCNDGCCLKGKNVVIGNSKVHGGSKDIKILDLGGETAVSQRVNELEVDNDLVDSCGEIGYFDDDALPNMDKIASQNYKSPNLTDLEGERAMHSIYTEADGCGKLDLLKENEISGIAESKFASLNHTLRGNEFDLTRNGGVEIALGNSKISKGKNDLSLIDPSRGNALQSDNIEADDELGDSFPADSSRTVTETGGDCLHDGKDFDADESRASPEGTQSDINDYQHDGDDHNADNLVLSQCGSIDCTILPESQESRVFGVEKFMELKKGGECAYMGEGTDSIKACSCSFCTKAAYIWLDLNYQDIKARVSAIKKSQKEASILAERSNRSKVIEKHGAESFSRVSKLESDLMYQWRSLFQHMADIWEEEGNQLEARLLPLTDLREKCKTDLELIDAAPSEKH